MSTIHSGHHSAGIRFYRNESRDTLISSISKIISDSTLGNATTQQISMDGNYHFNNNENWLMERSFLNQPRNAAPVKIPLEGTDGLEKCLSMKYSSRLEKCDALFDQAFR